MSNRSEAMRKLDSMIAPGGYDRWVNGELLGPKKSNNMKEITTEEIRELAEGIVSKTNESPSDYDAIDDVSGILKEMFTNMDIAVEEIKKNPDCKCKNCGCDK